MFLDVSKAHFYAPMLDEEFVQLPPRRWTEGKCARLIYILYGMRTAASNKEKEHSNTLEMMGFQSLACDCTCFLPRGTRGEDRRAR